MTKRKILWPIFSVIIFLSIILTIISFLVTQSDFVKGKVEQIFKNTIESNLNVKVEISETEGNILRGYTFHDITFFVLWGSGYWRDLSRQSWRGRKIFFEIDLFFFNPKIKGDKKK